jgi:hypothetical protein
MSFASEAPGRLDMSTATIPAGFRAVEGEDFTTAVLGPVAEGRPGVVVPVEIPARGPVAIPVLPRPDIGTIEDRVKRGALLLDATTPGWVEKISLDRLAMRNCWRCVLGQVYCSYVVGRVFLDLIDHNKAAGFGFTVTAAEYRECGLDALWLALANAWRAEIRSRRPEGRG